MLRSPVARGAASFDGARMSNGKPPAAIERLMKNLHRVVRGHADALRDLLELRPLIAIAAKPDLRVGLSHDGLPSKSCRNCGNVGKPTALPFPCPMTLPV
jgi:hypothetical protein